MSIPVNTGKANVTYDGNGSTTQFTIPFAFSTAGEIGVWLNGAPATGVTVFGAGDPFGGAAVFAAAPASGQSIFIRRLQSLHVSSNDRIAHALGDKLVAGPGIILTELNDGTDERLQIAAGSLQPGVPVGIVSAFAGSTAPEGWLFCDGSAISREAYDALYAVIGSTYGDGDGSTTFNLPDLRGRVAAGRDDMGGIAAGRLTAASAAGLDGMLLGAGGGVEQHQLTVAEMPSHRHAVRGEAAADGPNNNYVFRGVGPADGVTEYAGGDQPHTNLQPTLVLNSIIKA